jgi:hypothetical protein
LPIHLESWDDKYIPSSVAIKQPSKALSKYIAYPDFFNQWLDWKELGNLEFVKTRPPGSEVQAQKTLSTPLPMLQVSRKIYTRGETLVEKPACFEGCAYTLPDATPTIGKIHILPNSRYLNSPSIEFKIWRGSIIAWLGLLWSVGRHAGLMTVS